MHGKLRINWPLLWSVVKDHRHIFSILFGLGLAFCLVGGGIFVVGNEQIGAMIFGGLFALIGLAMLCASFVTTYSSVSYYYRQALLRRYGVDIDAVLTRKTAECHFHQKYDNNKRPIGKGHYQCDLLVEYDFQFNGSSYSGKYYLGKAMLFDRLKEGDSMPLRVLRLDPSVQRVRERRLANMLKGREPEDPSPIPLGAKISQSLAAKSGFIHR